MSEVITRFKTKPIRLKGKKKALLNVKVLTRDDLRCQNPSCNGGHPLDIPHHIIFKSAGGSDVEENLITTCIFCHDDIHKERLNVSGIAPDNLIWIKNK